MATLPRRRDAAFARPARRWAVLGGLIAVLTLSILGPWMSYSELPLAGEGSPVRQFAYIAAFAFVVFGCRPLDNPKRLLVVPVTILLALAWCWISMIWAIEPGIAIRR